MSRQGRRLHRLPQRLDYTLIPAPLNISLPLASEKSPLPAIIVTPSSPTDCNSEFFIAFSPKPSFRDRVSTYVAPFQLRARTAIILSLLLFIVVCHLFTHQFSTYRPHLRFDNFGAGSFAGDHTNSPDASSYWGWLGIKPLWNASMIDGKRDFIINEPLTS